MRHTGTHGEGEVEAPEFVKSVGPVLAATCEKIGRAQDELQTRDEEKTEPNRDGVPPATREALLLSDGGNDARGQVRNGTGGAEPSDSTERAQLLFPLPAPEAGAEVVLEEVRAHARVFSVELGREGLAESVAFHDLIVAVTTARCHSESGRASVWWLASRVHARVVRADSASTSPFCVTCVR